MIEMDSCKIHAFITMKSIDTMGLLPFLFHVQPNYLINHA